MENVKRKVLITGGSRGIGAACVSRFSKNGDSVVFIYRSDGESAARVSAETGANAVKCDISDPADVKRAVGEAIEKLGGVDVLVNNAGIAQIKLFTDITDGDWEKMLGTNLGGVFNCTREVLPHMIAKKSGKIVNISSMWGRTGASCEVHYSAAKAGVIGLTKALAKEVGPSGITVNCVAPGVIGTDMNASLDEQTVRELCDETPLCRIGKPEDVANAVFFLASDEASFITGQMLAVDGGMVI